MFAANDGLRLSATDVSNHLGCIHRTALDRLAALGELKRPFRNDAGINALRERGIAHEHAFLAALRARGREVLDLSEVRGAARYEETRAAMLRGVDIIAQGALQDGRWMGYPDVLRRVSDPSQLGPWSYEALDTKLSQETKAGAVLQLCLYSELLATVQGRWPTHLTIVPPSDNFVESVYRADSFAAYFRWVRRRLEESVERPRDTYPEPVPLCDVCDWWSDCDEKRRADDHLSLVAGITRLQRAELAKHSVTTLTSLAGLARPLPFRPSRGSTEALTRVREQARLQLVSRGLDVPVYELLDGSQEFGLAQLPEPTSDDLFLDLEGSPFAIPGGQEYLFGVSGTGGYRAWWAATETEEKAAFVQVIEAICDVRRANPGAHVFHYNHYEVTAFKRLACKYSVCESKLDQLLRGRAFVDLYPIAKNSVRAGIENYSIKSLEALYQFNRKADLRASTERRHALEAALELGRFSDVGPEDRELVQTYNEDDCESARALRAWLENRRLEFEKANELTLPRPEPPSEVEESDTESEELKRRREALRKGVPEDAKQRTESTQQARWLLAELLSWFWRERKARAWERYRLLALAPLDLGDEPRAVSGLALVKAHVGGTAACPVDRYNFPAQDVQIEPGDELFLSDPENGWGQKVGTVEAIDVAKGTLEIKKTRVWADEHPTFVLAWRDVPDPPLPEALERLADVVIASGLEGRGPLDASRQLLLTGSPRFSGGFRLSLEHAGAKEALPAVLALDDSILPIQGPPGSGKTTNAAKMICELVKAGQRVGVTASSHKVVHLLMQMAVKAAAADGRKLRCVHKVSELDEEPACDVGEHGIAEVNKNQAIDEALSEDLVDVVGGTPWLWAREAMRERVDVLFIDEAGQMWLASALAAAQGGKSVVLLGDPQQLDQVQQGTHPEGVAVSVLRHAMGRDETGQPRNTLSPERGLFLATTHRLAPAIAQFTSQVFYDGLLQTSPEAGNRQIVGSPFAGTGLWFVPVEHEGNTNASSTEADTVAGLVRTLLRGPTQFRDEKGKTRPLRPRDILVVTPFNAQVREIAARLRHADIQVGTVDKFQGQQAPVVIYSMATSSPEDAPRGMEFLYSLNRLNVAISRAQCVCILVASPALLEPNCQSPRQMQLANAFCRYQELAEELKT